MISAILEEIFAKRKFGMEFYINMSDPELPEIFPEGLEHVEVGPSAVPEIPAADQEPPGLDQAETLSGAIDLEDVRGRIDAIYQEQPPPVEISPDDTDGQAISDPAVTSPAGNESENKKSKKEKSKKPTVRVRPATPKDIPRLTEIDMQLYRKLYLAQGQDLDIRRKEVEHMLSKRLGNAGKLMLVTEIDGAIEAFMTCMITDKGPEEFESWESSTNDGTLDGVHSQQGKYIYTVNLTAKPKATDAGAHNMMMGRQLGHMIGSGIDSAYFESRIPLFGRWVERRLKEADTNIGSLSDDQLDELAQEYFESRVTLNGKEVRRDPMLRMYEQMGAKSVKVVKGAFDDPQSLNYGVVCTLDNPVPTWLRRKSLNWIVGKTAGAVLSKRRIANKIFG